VVIASARGLTQLVVLDIGPRAYPAFRFKEGDPDAIWPAFQHGGAVIVSESYAYRHELHVGTRLSLRTDRGMQAFPVVGIYYAYASDQGVVTMSRETYEAFWEDRGVSGVGLYAHRDADLDMLRQSVLREAAAGPQRLDVESNREILELSLRIFDRTFVITDVLRLLAALVAFLGVLGALMALQLERVRELGVLRAMGLTPGQLWRLVTAQTGLMGLAAGLLAVPLGLALALVLILVINRRAFGWTLQVHIAPEILLQGILLAVTAAVLAGIYPALKMSRISAAEALRAE
jgi:putative ABC transport system permease protein